MANRTMRYYVTWCFREDGNRTVEGTNEIQATSVPRAIAKLVRQLNEEEPASAPLPGELRASDLFILDVRSVMFDRTVQLYREDH